LYNIYNTTHEFIIKYIINLTGKAADPLLMPAFPGLEGKLDCADWEPPFPIDITRLSQLDREYWLAHRGTPKAYITLAQAQSLWSTNLGKFTMIKLNTTTAEDNLGFIKLQINDRLDADLGYSEAGLSIDHVKSDALDTARGMAIFPMMFLAFGSAIIIAGIALIVTIFLILADARKYELGIGRAIGLRKNQVIKLFLLEGVLYALIAGIIGVIFGLFLGWSLVYALNSIWSSAVESYTIPFYFKPISLIISFFVGFVITIITIFLTARHIGKMNIISALHNLPTSERTTKRGLFVLGGFLLVIGILLLLINIIGLSASMENSEVFINLFAPVLILLALGFISGYFVGKVKTRGHIISTLTLAMICYVIIYAIFNFSKSNIPTVELFFSVGLLLVFGVTIITIINLRALANALINLLNFGKKPRPVVAYSLQNPTRRVARTGQLITIFTLVIFLIAALSINIAIQQVSVNAVSYEQRGGYDIIGETAVPISIDLENASQRIKHNIDAPTLDNLQITEIKMVGPQGGTCSNMNVRYPPRLLGVNANFLHENSFQFMETLSDDDTPRNTWSDLEKTAAENNGRMPIVVDYNTLVWIYGGALGEIYTIDDEAGETIKLEVIGVLENSVFGGTFIMSEENLEQLYPTSAEYRYALFKIKPGVKSTPEELASDLERELHQYGMDTQAIRQLILENQAYERSFMVLFQAFLALGLIVGVIGMGVVTARNVQERRFEVGILRALGFNRKMVLKAFILEPAFTGFIAILLGSIIGILSAFLAFGAWAETNFKFVLPWADLGLFAIVIYTVVLLAAAYPAYRASKLPPAEALQRVS
jgi:putative ABC transport system permease protein